MVLASGLEALSSFEVSSLGAEVVVRPRPLRLKVARGLVREGLDDGAALLLVSSLAGAAVGFVRVFGAPNRERLNVG